MNLRKLAYAALLGALTYLQPYRPFVVNGDSMSPSFDSGQWVVGIARPARLSRGDVVVFHHGAETMIKRVAYLPGDHIERYLVVDQWIVPPNERNRASMIRQRLRRNDLVVPERQLFVVGDNVYGSVDSRTYGPILSRDVVAVVPRAPTLKGGWYAPSHLTRSMVAAL